MHVQTWNDSFCQHVSDARRLAGSRAGGKSICRSAGENCDHGWDIDLDDRFSYYVITNNLCLHEGIKNRGGFGLPGVTGVLVLEVPADSAPAKAGLQKNDVILSVNGGRTADVATLLRQSPDPAARQTLTVGVSRNQKEILLSPTP